MTKEIQLYEYQKDMLRQIEDAFVTHQSVMVQMPTGTGKTVLLAEQVKSEERRVKNPDGVKSEERRVKNPDGVKSEETTFADRRESQRRVKNPCVWIVVHRRELVEQIKETLAKQLDSSLFTFHSSLTPLDSSLFTLPSSLTLRVFSIQWLSRHYKELEERPSLIVIDEAHHALAKTYAEMMNAYPEAKKLGVTATPCRLNKRGFTDLFEVLLTSQSISNFIKDGYLSDFDYVSLNPSSEDQKKIDRMSKRATDGDYSIAEMQEVLDCKPSIGRLYQTIKDFASGKKGIVYAINIEHAEHIAEFYRERGLNAVAISSKTPAEERKNIIERFKNTNFSLKDTNGSFKNTNCHELSTNLTTNCHEFKILAQASVSTSRAQNSKIQNRLCRQFKTQNSCSGKRLYEPSAKLNILINVDLFGEGFDCPDVEFIQLARPTLSLAKYLQMVGRGLRVAKNKECCIILDNVGLYRLFGLPNAERDWKAMFLGQQTGKGVVDMARDWALRLCNFSENSQVKGNGVCNRDMVVIARHDMPRITEQYAYPMNNVEQFQQHGFAMFHSRKKIDRELPWADLMNGIRFAKQPRVETHGFLEFSTTDGVRLYPRVMTRLMDSDSFVLPEALTHGIDDGLRFRNFYIPPSDTPKLYVFKEKMDNMTLFKDEDRTYYIRYGLEPKLTPISLDEWSAEKRKWKRMVADFEKRAEEREKTGVFKYPLQAKVSSYKLTDYNEPSDIRITRNGKAYNTFCFDIRFGKWKPTGSYTEFSRQAYGIRVVRNWEGKYLLRTLFFEKFGEEEDPKFDFAELLDEAYLHIIENGQEYYVDLESNMCFDRIPEMIEIGFVKFQKDGDMYFPFHYRLNARRPFRRGEIIGGDDICFIGKHIVVLKGDSSVYYIRRRYTDGKRFVVSKTKQESISETLYDLYYDGKNPAEIKARETNCI